MKKFLLFCILSVTALGGCTKENEVYAVGEDQWPTVKAGAVSEKAFRDAVVGFGWKSGVTYTMKGGKVTKEVYGQGLKGYSSYYGYFFDENKRVAFLSPDWYPCNGFYKRSYEYRPDGCAVFISGYKEMVIARVGSNSFDAIELMGVSSDGEKHFGFTTYYRMSSEELSAARSKYDTDLDSVMD